MIMDRKRFLKNCTSGLCTCTVAGFVFPAVSSASETEVHEDWRFPFIQQRHARLLEILSEKLSDTELTETLQKLGAFCASKGQLIQKHDGDVEGYIDEFKKLSGDDIIYDREKRTITITGSERDNCFCPLVDQKITPKKFCDCSRGWHEYTWETLLGKKVKAELKESILYGNKRCAFQIHISNNDI